VITLFIIATIMAVFGVYGYRRGFWPMVIALGALLFAVLLIDRVPEQLVMYMNAIYVSTMLLFRGGLTAIVNGDLDEAKQMLSSIEKPFSGDNEKWALLIVLIGAATVGLLVSLFIKSKPSIWGLILGLVYGYVLSLNVTSLIFGSPETALVPGQGTATGGPGLIDRLIAALTNPETSAVCGSLVVFSIVVLVIVAVISATKTGKRAQSKGNGSSTSATRTGDKG
jgi:hypothetical protein